MSAGDWKAMFRAACEGDVHAVQFALAAGIDPDYQHPEFGTTVLMGAAEAGQLEVVRLLLQSNANAALRAQWDGVTALEAALSHGHSEIVGLLAEHTHRATQ